MVAYVPVVGSGSHGDGSHTPPPVKDVLVVVDEWVDVADELVFVDDERWADDSTSMAQMVV